MSRGRCGRRVGKVLQLDIALERLKAHCYAAAEARRRDCMFEMVGPGESRDDLDAIGQEARCLLAESGASDAMGVAAEALLLMEEVERLPPEALEAALGTEVAGWVAAAQLPEEHDPFTWMQDDEALPCLAQMPAGAHTLRAALLLAQWRRLPDSPHHAEVWWREAEHLSGADPALLAHLRSGLLETLGVSRDA